MWFILPLWVLLPRFVLCGNVIGQLFEKWFVCDLEKSHDNISWILINKPLCMFVDVLLIVVRPVNLFFISTILLMGQIIVDTKRSLLFLSLLLVLLLQLLDLALTAEEIGWQLVWSLLCASFFVFRMRAGVISLLLEIMWFHPFEIIFSSCFILNVLGVQVLNELKVFLNVFFFWVCCNFWQRFEPVKNQKPNFNLEKLICVLILFFKFLEKLLIFWTEVQKLLFLFGQIQKVEMIEVDGPWNQALYSFSPFILSFSCILESKLCHHISFICFKRRLVKLWCREKLISWCASLLCRFLHEVLVSVSFGLAGKACNFVGYLWSEYSFSHIFLIL